MQENVINKIKRTAKKAVALGTSALMAGASMGGIALAATDFAGFPAPFVKAGTFDAYVVVGANANTADTLGALEVSTALGQLATSGSSDGSIDIATTVFKGKNEEKQFNSDNEGGGFSLGTDIWAVGGPTAKDDSELPVLNYVEIKNTQDSTDIKTYEKLDIDRSLFNLTKDFKIVAKASTSSDEPFKIELGTNRTNNQFFEGDLLKWDGKTYEITNIEDDGSKDYFEIGSSEEVPVNNPAVGQTSEFKVGSKTFTLTNVASSDNLVGILDSSGDFYTINTTEQKIDGVFLRVKSGSIPPFAGQGKLTLLTSTTSNKYVEDDKFLNSEWVIEDLTVTEDGKMNKLILTNSFAVELGESEVQKLHDGLNFVFEELLKDDSSLIIPSDETAAESYTIGDIILVKESESQEMIITSVNQADGGELTATNSGLLPGYEFKTIVSGTGALATITQDKNLNNLVTDGEVVYVVNQNDQYELILTGQANGVGLTIGVPKAASKTTTSSDTGDYNILTSTDAVFTTPSGITVNPSTGKLTIKAIVVKANFAIGGVASTTKAYFGALGSSGFATNDGYYYTTEGNRIGWESGTPGSDGSGEGTLRILQGLTNEEISVKVEFTSDGNATFSYEDVSGVSIENTNVDTTTEGIKVGKISGNLDNDDTTAEGILGIVLPKYSVKFGIGSYEKESKTFTSSVKTLDFGSGSNKVTVVLENSAGLGQSINKVNTGFGKLDTEISENSVNKPLILIGGWGANDVAAKLIVGADREYLGTSNEAVLYYYESSAALNNQPVFAIVGIDADDTRLASRVVANSLLRSTPLDFSDFSGKTRIKLNTGGTSVSGVTVTESK